MPDKSYNIQYTIYNIQYTTYNYYTIWQLVSIYWFGPKSPKEDFYDLYVAPRFRTKKRIPRTQKLRFWKNEKAFPGIHPIYKCGNFNMIALFFEFSRLPQSFDSKFQQTNKNWW